MIKTKNILLILLFMFLISNKISFASLNVIDSTFYNSEDKLLLIKEIPIGTDYRNVKQIIPDLSELKKEGLPGNLYEAKANIFILNLKCKIEFNFKSNDTMNTLYSYYYFIDSLTNNTADSLYQLLKKFYNEHYGYSSEEKEIDPADFYSITSFWETDEFSIVLTNNVYHNYNILGLGFQRPRKR